MKKISVLFLSLFVVTSVFAIEKCPDGGELRNGVCCKNGKALGGDLKQYSFIRPACGCPDGGKPGVSGHMCCKAGKSYNRETQQYDELTPYCGCPDGGETVLSAGGIPTCCKNYRSWNKLKKIYDGLYPSVCGCPDGGILGASHNYFCCKNNYEYNPKTQVYDDFNPFECGCPDEGKLQADSNYNRSVCCKNNYEYNEETKTYDKLSVDVCGCPVGSELRTGEWGKKWCCKNGLAQSDFEGPLVEIKACGCPDGGQIWQDRFCQKGGYIWNDITKQYDMPNAVLGCPQGTQDKNGVCCKNGYAFNAYTAKFESINGVCGCQKGSRPSEWGTKYKQLLASGGQKRTLEEQAYENRVIAQLNAVCCKEGKRYNEETGQFDLDSNLCGPFPTTGEELFLKLFEEAKWGRLMLH